MIKRFAQHLTDAFGNRGIIARFGGDEFVVMLEHSADFDVASRLNELNQQIAQEEYEPKLCYSSGLASRVVLAKDVRSLEQLIGEADKKMYQTKQPNCSG